VSSENNEVDAQAEVVARPDAVDRLVEDPLARRDLQRRPLVLAAADEDVVDPPEGPVPSPGSRACWCATWNSGPSTSITWSYSSVTIDSGNATRSG
jgi:hypothetical protein